MKTQDNKPKDTGMAAVLILLLIAWFTATITWVIPAIVVLVLTMTIPVVFKPLAIVWFGLANLMGHVVSTVILTTLYFFVLMPVGVIRRMGGADALGLKKWRNGDESAFVVRDHPYAAGDLEKPY
ncbi:MAG: hypothetical protein GY697_19720 [Desulfobacterales bacterium]|nr:hypothetical protein [Desulfobacterales bacterium]